MKHKKQENNKPDFARDLAGKLPLVMREFARRQQNFFARAALTVPQIVILELLAEQGPCKMSALAKMLNLTMSAVTAIVDKMVNLRLLKRERPAEDRRVVKVMLLAKGAQMAKRIQELRCTCLREIFSVLKEGEKREYARMLTKVYDNLKLREEK